MMKRFLYLFAILLSLDAWAFPQAVGGRYVITADENLQGRFIQLEEGSTLVFRGGTLRNGVLVGNDCRIELETDTPVFDEVQLNGSWSGSLTDKAFVYRDKADHYRIVASLFRFNQVVFTRSEYRVGTWVPIHVNAHYQEVEGNGVVFVITADKGEMENGKWGKQYKRETLFCNSYEESGNLSYAYHNLTILDNRELIGEQGWGEDIRDFHRYSYFSVVGRKVLFDRVSSDGAGVLEKIYNTRNQIEEITFVACSVRTSQFAVEIQNVSWMSEDVRCGNIVFDDCSFYQYGAQKYVGLLSVVGTVPTDSLRIRNCRFDGTEKAGNLELTSARNIEVDGCSFVNQFLQSEPENGIGEYNVHDNTFRFTKHVGTQPYSFGGARIRFVDNVIVFENKMTRIRVIGNVERFDERNNRYYIENGGRNKRTRETPFQASKTLKVPDGVGSFLRSLYYRF